MEQLKEILNLTNYVSLIIPILTIIFTWKIYEKANQPGWKALIPGYNKYILFKICWNTKIFFIELALFLGIIICIITGSYIAFLNLGFISLLMSNLFLVTCIISFIIILVIEIKIKINLSICFKKRVWFYIGIIIFPAVFLGILAFDNSEYNKLEN